MILRSLHVEGWRCFADAVRVGPFQDGVNVIHGPNGSGKTTLMLAMVRALFDGHRTAGVAVKQLRPWGRELNPAVTVEWEQQQTRYRLRKQFFASASSELQRLEGGQFVRLAESDAADQLARQVLAGDAPGRGLSDQRHWGWAQLLWAPQGNLALPELSPAAAQAIHAALGAQLAGADGDRVERKLLDAYQAIFTSTGRLRGGEKAPRIVEWNGQLVDARRQHLLLSEKLQAYEQGSRRIEDLRHLCQQAQRDEGEIAAALRDARVRAEQFQQLQQRRIQHEQAALAAEQSYLRIQGQIDNIQNARREQRELAEQLQQLQVDEPLYEREIAARRRDTELARADLDQVRSRRQQVDAARQAARLAERFRAAREKLAETDRLLQAIDATRLELDKLREQRGNLAAPDDETLQAIMAAERSVQDAQVRLEAALITVSLAAQRELDIEVLCAEQTGPVRLLPGEPLQLRGSPEVALQLPGLLSLRASGPRGDSDQLRRELDEAIARRQTLTAGFPYKSGEQLQPLRQQANQLEALIGQMQVRLETLLDGQTEELLRELRLRSANSVDEVLAQQPAWKAEPPQVEPLHAEADDVQRRFVTAVEAAERVLDQASEAFTAVTQRQSRFLEAQKALQRQIASLDQRLADLTSDGLSDAERARQRDQWSLQWRATKTELQQVEQQLAQSGGDPRPEAEALDRQLQAVRRQASDTMLELKGAEVRQQQLSAEAPYSAAAAVEERIQELQDLATREQRRINAIRLLYETLTECKRAAVETIVGPIQNRATRILKRIAGGQIGGVRLSGSFLPEAIAPESAGEGVGLDQLSGGEQEQVHFAVRLALADVAFAGERQLLVLDDAFTFTDTPRLARVMTILQEYAQRFQIIVLTCHPERYLALPDAALFDLPSIARQR